MEKNDQDRRNNTTCDLELEADIIHSEAEQDDTMSTAGSRDIFMMLKTDHPRPEAALPILGISEFNDEFGKERTISTTYDQEKYKYIAEDYCQSTSENKIDENHHCTESRKLLQYPLASTFSLDKPTIPTKLGGNNEYAIKSLHGDDTLGENIPSSLTEHSTEDLRDQIDSSKNDSHITKKQNELSKILTGLVYKPPLQKKPELFDSIPSNHSSPSNNDMDAICTFLSLKYQRKMNHGDVSINDKVDKDFIVELVKEQTRKHIEEHSEASIKSSLVEYNDNSQIDGNYDDTRILLVESDHNSDDIIIKESQTDRYLHVLQEKYNVFKINSNDSSRIVENCIPPQRDESDRAVVWKKEELNDMDILSKTGMITLDRSMPENPKKLISTINQLHLDLEGVTNAETGVDGLWNDCAIDIENSSNINSNYSELMKEIDGIVDSQSRMEDPIDKKMTRRSDGSFDDIIAILKALEEEEKQSRPKRVRMFMDKK